MSARTGPQLRGRGHECGQLEGLLAAVRSGQGQALVLRGEAGIGKTALLTYLEERGASCGVVKVAGVESEMELAYAGLHQLCAPLLDRVDRLPAPQRAALGVAFGTERGPAPDVLFVGLAVLGLMADAAEERPLLCLVDDVQWLDAASATVLGFVARRVAADPVGIVLTVREPADLGALAGLPELSLRGLGEEHALSLLESAIPGRIDPEVRSRIISETRGNPLAVLELTRALSPAQLAGGFASVRDLPVSARVEEVFVRRFGSLPDASRMLALVAAAEPRGDVHLLWRAAAELGIEPEAAVALEADGLLDLGAHVRFPHPLARSALYREANPAERRAAHAALAEVTDAETEPDRRAWHRAQAASGPDEDVAAELERSASRARDRGGAAAAAAFLTRSSELTTDAVRRAERALAAAEAALDAGTVQEASRLVTAAEVVDCGERHHASVLRLRARVAFAQRRGTDAPPFLLEAARRLDAIDPRLARDAHLDALESAIFAGRLAQSPTIVDIASAARRAPASPGPPRLVDLLVDGLAVRFTEGHVAGVGPLREALAAVRDQLSVDEVSFQCLWMATRLASELWDDETWHEVTVRALEFARSTGAGSALPSAATYRAGVHIHAGEFGAASALMAEAAAFTDAVGSAPLLYTTLVLAAWRGRESELSSAMTSATPDVTARGEGRGVTWCEYATALLHNGLRNYDAAMAAARSAAMHDDIGITNWVLVELIEASAHCGRLDIAAEALEQLASRTQPSGTEWAHGIEARSRALLSDGSDAEALYREAVDRLSRTRVAVHLARAHLLFGEWLRRENRRSEARDHLRTAHDMLGRFGADGFAERARRELMATGETVRKRSAAATADFLTAQELQIAELARDGYTNPEIGGQLFISPRTVEYHLRKVFTKLEITSRRELRSVAPERLLNDPAS